MSAHGIFKKRPALFCPAEEYRAAPRPRVRPAKQWGPRKNQGRARGVRRRSGTCISSRCPEEGKTPPQNRHRLRDAAKQQIRECILRPLLGTAPEAIAPNLDESKPWRRLRVIKRLDASGSEPEENRGRGITPAQISRQKAHRPRSRYGFRPTLPAMTQIPCPICGEAVAA